MTPIARRIFALAVLLLALGCEADRVSSGPGILRGTQAITLRQQEAFGPEPTVGIVQIQNPPTGTAVVFGPGEVTPRSELNAPPMPVATPTGQPNPLDAGVDVDASSTDAGVGDAGQGVPANTR